MTLYTYTDGKARRRQTPHSTQSARMQEAVCLTDPLTGHCLPLMTPMQTEHDHLTALLPTLNDGQPNAEITEAVSS